MDGAKKRKHSGAAGGKDPEKKRRATAAKNALSKPVQPKGKQEGGKGPRKVSAKAQDIQDLLTQSKSIWERIRDMENVTKDERHMLITELLGMLDTRMMDVIRKQDGSRVLQTCLKHGNAQHRDKIFNELSKHFLELSKLRYSRFLAGSMVKYGTRKQLEFYLQQTRGHVVKMLKHAEGSVVLERLFSLLSPNQRLQMLKEIYHPEAIVLSQSTFTSLTQLLEDNKKQRDKILNDLKELIIFLVDKGLSYNAIVHKLLADFYQAASYQHLVEMSSLIAPTAIHLVKTREGTVASMMCATYGSAKDRKVILKSIKGEVANLSKEPFGHMFIVRLLDVVDDTTLLGKVIVQELISGFDELVCDKYGRLPILYILQPTLAKYLTPQFVALMVSTVTNEEGEEVKVSKKATEKRREELQQVLVSPLLQYCNSHTKEVLLSSYGCVVLQDLLLLDVDGKQPLYESIAGIVSDTTADPAPLTDMFVSRCVRRLIRPSEEPSGESFASILLNKMAGDLSQWMTQIGSVFVVVSLCEHPDTASQTKKSVSSVLKTIKEDTLPPQVQKGIKILREKCTAN